MGEEERVVATVEGLRRSSDFVSIWMVSNGTRCLIFAVKEVGLRP